MTPFEEGQRVCVAASALKKLLGREPAEGELYRTVRTIHPDQPERWVMLDWPFHWFEVADVAPLRDNPPRPKWGPISAEVVSEQALRDITFSWEDCAVVKVRRDVRAREDARMWKVLDEITADKPKEGA